MKIGIITFHCSYNYGSVLQAFALQEYINRNIGQAQIVDFVQPENFKQYRLFRRHLYLAHPRSLAGDLAHMLPNWKRKRSFQGFVRRFVPVTPRRYTTCGDLAELNGQFDAFICGSDQIWNPVCTNGLEPAYFLQFVQPGKKKVAYACSIGHAHLDAEYLDLFRTYLEGLSSICVREKTAQRYLSALTNRPIQVALDPTLLLDRSVYIKMMPPVAASGYLFVYMLEQSDPLVTYAENLARQTGKKIIYFSAKQERRYRDAVNAYGVPPERFLRYLHDADCVITNSFHATVFSVLFEKRFCAFRTEKSASRVEDLLSSLGLSGRLFAPGFDMNETICYSKVNERLNRLRTESARYLIEALR